MNFDLTPEQAAIRAVAREFADAELGDKIAPYDERHEFAADIVAKLGPLGFMGHVLGSLANGFQAPELFAATALVSAASIAIVLGLDALNDRLSHWRG